MEEKYKIYFDKYIKYITTHYNLSKKDINKIIGKEKLANFIKLFDSNYITEKDFESENIIEKIYELYLSCDVSFDAMKGYFDTYIYMDKYGIGDFCIEKDNLLIVDNLYNHKVQITIREFMGMNYSIIDRLYISQDQKFDDVLEFLHLQIKRGNIKVRALDVYNWSEEKETDVFKLIQMYDAKEFTKENADEILKDLKKMYLNASNKNDFLEYFVEINLVENERSSTGLWGK